MLLEIIDILKPRKVIIPKLQIIEITAVKRGRITPLTDLKLINKIKAMTKKEIGNNLVKSLFIKSEIVELFPSYLFFKFATLLKTSS